MNTNLSFALIIFSILWFLILLGCIKASKITVKYSMVWFLVILVILFVGLFPNLLETIGTFLGFTYLSNFVIGILITLLMLIILALTVIASNLKQTVRLLTQELSLLKEKVNTLEKKKK